MNQLWKASLLGLTVATTAPSYAQVFNETEDNNTTETANIVSGFGVGNTIVGSTTGSSTVTAGSTSSDNFRIGITGGTTQIYRNRFLLTTTGTQGHTMSFRGFTQSAGVINTSSNASFVSSSVLNPTTRFLQWYGFGKQEQIDLRVTGTASTTNPYTIAMTQEVVTPTAISQTFNEGTITFNTFGTGTDTALMILDANLNPIAGYKNDDSWTDAPTNTVTTTQSFLSRNFTAGTYYIAVARWNLNDNLAAPAGERTPTDNVLRTPGWIVASSTNTATANTSVTISGGGNQFVWTNSVSGAYEANFARFEVVPEPATMTALGLGVAALMRRKKKSSK